MRGAPDRHPARPTGLLPRTPEATARRLPNRPHAKPGRSVPWQLWNLGWRDIPTPLRRSLGNSGAPRRRPLVGHARRSQASRCHPGSVCGIWPRRRGARHAGARRAPALLANRPETLCRSMSGTTAVSERNSLILRRRAIPARVAKKIASSVIHI